MDLVNLIRQVAVEHREKLAEEGLELRWKVPEGKVSLELDAQKTYRVFENLFVNLEKYAMPNSRSMWRSRRRTTRCARSSRTCLPRS